MAQKVIGYFQVFKKSGTVYVLIANAKSWDENQEMDDFTSPAIRKVLPKTFVEEVECLFTSSVDVATTTKQLFDVGLREAKLEENIDDWV